MHMYSHSLIGKTVYKFIIDRLGFKLNSGSLIFGCIKPDVSIRLANVPHYKNESFHFISNRIIAMQTSKFTDNPTDLKFFSEQLGIILHYVSDYFCYPHNNKLMEKLPEHFLYEINLDFELNKYLSKSFDHLQLNLSDEDYINSEKSLIQYIECKHNQYLMESPSTTMDILYSLQVCCTVAINIVTSSITKTYRKVS